jgi:hypothetical protein
MRSSRLAVSLIALVVLLSGILAPSAGAVGAQVYRTDSQGRKTGTVANVGNTGSSAFCAGFGLGTIGYGVMVCYL